MMKDALVRTFGWPATIFHGDPTVVDRWRWLRSHLRTGPVRTLDAGCGSGVFTLYTARRGNRAVGISFGEPEVERGRRRARLLHLDDRVEFRSADLRRLDEFGPELGRFDQILLFECIEHIKDDAKLVRDLAGLLAPGGTLLLTAPYKHHHALWGETVTEVEDGGHVRFGYTHDELRALLEAQGLKILAEEYISGVVSQALASVQFRLTRLNSYLAWAATLPFRVLHPLDGPLTRMVRYPHLSVGVVARKPGGDAVPVGAEASGAVPAGSTAG